MDRERWLVERQKGLGGSDAAAALGLSRWKTPYQLYLEKRGEAPPVEETEPMRWGKLLEPLVLQRYADETGHELTTHPYELHWSADKPFMFVTPDALVIGQKRGVEAKTARSKDGWGEPGTDDIPQGYVIQAAHLAIVKKLEVVDVPVLFGGQDFAIYEVPAPDAELRDIILDGEADFWSRVLRGEPPVPVTLDDVNLRYGKRSAPLGTQASADIVNSCAALAHVKAEQKALAEREAFLKVQIQRYMAHNENLLHGREILATWKMDVQGRFDNEAFKAENPQLYESYRKPPIRRFLLK